LAPSHTYNAEACVVQGGDRRRTPELSPVSLQMNRLSAKHFPLSDAMALERPL
jgi:hypothetical protein